jgi:hypothetical protein
MMVSVPADCVRLPLTVRMQLGPNVMLPLLARAPAVVKDWRFSRLKLPPAAIAARPLRLVKVALGPLSVTLALLPMVVKAGADWIVCVEG